MEGAEVTVGVNDDARCRPTGGRIPATCYLNVKQMQLQSLTELCAEFIGRDAPFGNADH